LERIAASYCVAAMCSCANFLLEVFTGPQVHWAQHVRVYCPPPFSSREAAFIR